MKKKFYLLRSLTIIFRISELFIGIGIISSLALLPYAGHVIDARGGSLGLYVDDGVPGFDFTHGATGFSWSSLEHRSGAALAHVKPASPGLCSITFGSFRMPGPKAAPSIPLANSSGSIVEMDAVEGSFTFPHPASAAQLLAEVQWPFVICILCTGGTTIAILELLSRLFRKVQAGEVFTPATIWHAHAIGSLVIASSLLKAVTSGWLKHAMAAVVMQQAAPGAIYLGSSTNGDSSGIVTGLVILALAEVFRQGLRLKEENALTI